MSHRAKLACVVVAVAGIIATGRGLHPFLAVTDPVGHAVLVLEGWMPAYVVTQVAQEIRSRDYRFVLISRPLYSGRTTYESGEALAKYVADELAELGVPKERIWIVFSQVSNRDRTYSSAIAVKKWMDERGIQESAIDVGTLGAHARRSRLLFQRAFGRDVAVGVIAFEDQDFDSSRWWRSSAGVRVVPAEFMAYLYARLFFHPSD